MSRRPPRSTLFPYTTLFRSHFRRVGLGDIGQHPYAAQVGDGIELRLRHDLLAGEGVARDRKSTRLNSSHPSISYAVFCLKKKKLKIHPLPISRSSPSPGPSP